jgi:hypothetical protein
MISIIHIKEIEMKETNKQTDNVKKDLCEIKLTIAILQEQVKKLAEMVLPQPMYTQEELHEIAEYRRKK